MQMRDPQNAIPGIEQAKPVIDELAAREEVIAIILSGSVARGQTREISDIDICVMTKKGAPEPVKMDLLSYGSEKTDVSLFYDLPITIRFRVIREGKLLFCRDTPGLHAIMARANPPGILKKFSMKMTSANNHSGPGPAESHGKDWSAPPHRVPRSRHSPQTA
jgi:predicted nucleotidyltransferase